MIIESSLATTVTLKMTRTTTNDQAADDRDSDRDLGPRGGLDDGWEWRRPAAGGGPLPAAMR